MLAVEGEDEAAGEDDDLPAIEGDDELEPDPVYPLRGGRAKDVVHARVDEEEGAVPVTAVMERCTASQARPFTTVASGGPTPVFGLRRCAAPARYTGV